jgi:hypothetical protein
MTPNVNPSPTGRTVLSAAAPESGRGRVTRQASGLVTLLIVLLGVGAVWAWSRPRPPHNGEAPAGHADARRGARPPC